MPLFSTVGTKDDDMMECYARFLIIALALYTG